MDTFVLFFVAEKKLRKLTEAFGARSAETHFIGCHEAAQVDELLSSGKRLVVVHKAGYDMALRDADAEAAARYAALTRLPAQQLLDPVDRAVCFADRRRICHALRALAPTVMQPQFVELSGSLAEVRSAAAALSYPLLCKPCVACGPLGHELTLVLREEGLADLCTGPQASLPLPLLAQEFVNHDGIVLKAYAVGSLTHVTTQQSLPDLPLRRPADRWPSLLHIDSQHSLAGTVEALGALVHASDCASPARTVVSANVPLDEASSSHAATAAATLLDRWRPHVERVVASIRAHMGVELLGVDLLATSDGRLLVVDANHFSGSPKSVPGFMEALAQVVQARLSD